MPEKELRIVPFEPEDLDPILEIEKRVYATPWSRQSYEDLISLNDIHTWVAKSDERLVGYMLFQATANDMELHTIAVLPEQQSKGIGRRLMEHLIREAEKFGAEHIFLQVRPSNRHAIALYAKFGFVTIGVRKRYYEDNSEDACIMRLTMREFVDNRDRFS